MQDNNVDIEDNYVDMQNIYVDMQVINSFREFGFNMGKMTYSYYMTDIFVARYDIHVIMTICD